MDVSQNMCSIKQEFIENEIDFEEVDLKLIKDEPCSIDTFYENKADTVPQVKEEIDTPSISYIENVTVDPVPNDIEFIKCEGESMFSWNANENDPLSSYDQDIDMNIKTESSDITNECSNDNNKEVPISENITFHNDINTRGLVVQEETSQIMLKEEECESINSNHQESPSTSMLNSDICVDANINENQHGRESETQYTCPQCRYSTPIECLYKFHLKTHCRRNVRKCSQCSYTTSKKSNLVRHVNTHSGKKPYDCSLCSYSTTQKHHLVRHMRTHTGEKPYKCSQCSYCAIQKSDVVVHMRTHTGEKPYKCSQCSYSASHTSTLIEHMRTHTGEKPYKCSQCNYSATQKYTLVIHMKTHAREKP